MANKTKKTVWYRMMLVIIFEQIFQLYFDAGGRSLLIGDRLENCWLAISNSCNIRHVKLLIDNKFFKAFDELGK